MTGVQTLSAAARPACRAEPIGAQREAAGMPPPGRLRSGCERQGGSAEQGQAAPSPQQREGELTFSVASPIQM